LSKKLKARSQDTKQKKKRKQNWDEVFINEMRRGKRGRGEREKVKCHEMFGDKKG
jgi:hypothetical protein